LYASPKLCEEIFGWENEVVEVKEDKEVEEEGV